MILFSKPFPHRERNSSVTSQDYDRIGVWLQLWSFYFLVMKLEDNLNYMWQLKSYRKLILTDQ